MIKDGFYNAKIEIYEKEFIKKGFNLMASYKLAKEKLELEYDKKGRYLGYKKRAT